MLSPKTAQLRYFLLEYCALGELARRRFGGISQLKELKYELAVPKICGAFWLAKEKLNLGNDVAAYLSILLPPGEVQDKEQLQVRLKDAFEDLIHQQVRCG
ncbi:hypothetical protein [Nostoc favosum]|uniref:Uncharacterized protein n=1 Tax=Nostoc favosum CHAB5714 TaxID=2780399 RepID=A0ABS8IGH6_9NOSO|nr:hypothetical protein [Nostoc favosum]MCC5603279.1 hypothetical protein [Nostoc favosum CHAB5714]